VTSTDVVVAVGQAVTRMFHAVDDLDWDTVRASFAPEVATDYTSLWGGEPAVVTPDALVEGWLPLAPGYDATQHLLGPIEVTPADTDRATCTANVRAYHHVRTGEHLSGTWLVVGRYAIEMTGLDGAWRIASITLRTFYEEGDRRLVDVARARTGAGAGGRALTTA
jgi:SnoaL-like domain